MTSVGAIVTNYHVIATGNVAMVKFADGTVVPVDGVLATDKFHDLAVSLKINGKNLSKRCRSATQTKFKEKRWWRSAIRSV